MFEKPTYEDLEKRIRDLEKKVYEKEKTENTLRQLGASYDRLTEYADFAITRVSTKGGRVLYQNPAAQKIFGFTKEDHNDPDFAFKVICPEYREKQRQIIHEINTHKQPIQNVELAWMNKSGQKIIMIHTIIPVIDEEGCLTCFEIISRDITKSKQTEQAFYHSEKKWKNILINTPQIGVAINTLGKVIFANDRFLKLTEWEEKEIIGQDWFDIFIPEKSREEIRNIFYKTIKADNSLDFTQFENKIKTKSGELLNVAWANLLTRDEEGNVLDITCLGIDLTERKEAERKMKDLESQLYKALQIAHLGHWELDIEKDTLKVSDHFYKIFGTTAEKEGGYTMVSAEYARRFVHPEDRYVVQEEIRKCLGTSDPDFTGYREHRIVYTTGETGYISLWYFIKKNKHGRTIKSCGLMQDITERKKTEMALKESEERFKVLHNASFGGIAIHDRGVIVECNRGLSDISGFEYHELIGLDGLALVSDETRNTVIQNINSGYEKAYEAEGIRKSGEVYPLRVEGRNIPYKGKNLRVVEFRDITETKQAEKEKEALESKLLQAQKMEAVGRLAGGVAHDFNNMLGVIIGYADMALEEMLPTDSYYIHLDEIRKAAERSAALTQKLLAFARKQTVSPKVLNLNDTVAGMIRMLKRIIGENILLEWLPGEDVWPVKIDPNQIDQILANLSVNARDAISDTGEITIQTENTKLNDTSCIEHPDFLPGEYVLLSFKDNGCGMTAETVKNIFEPFFTTKETGKGTGLGLATVYGVVRQNKGFVDVYSEAGAGAIFKIYLPRHYENVDLLSGKTAKKEINKGYETILLVEDEPSILRMTKTMIERLGYQVIAAQSPGEAIHLAGEYGDKIHLLITDVVMPEMNGRDLAQKILSFYPNLKRLFMSGYTADIIANHGVVDEGVAFIQKPFSLEKLETKIRRVLDETPI